MKRFSIGLIVGVILGIVLSLGYLFFKGPKKGNPELEQKKEEVENLKQEVDSLVIQLDSLRARKPERIEVIKRLPAKEKIIYLEKALDEVDSTRVDSISFVSPADTSQVIISTEDLSRIDGIIEERDILKEEVVMLDSIVEMKDSIILAQDTIITEQEVVIGEQKKEMKKQKKKFLGITIGGGSAALLLVLLLAL